MTGVHLLLSDRNGVYIPQLFVKQFDGWKNIDSEDTELLLKGPEEDWYWDTWDQLMGNAEYTDQLGYVWKLYQDGDLFAICEELMTDEEKENFGYDQ
jgi:hypothetical protein